MQLPSYYSDVIKHHTLNLAKPIESSTGMTTDYFDGIGAFLCNRCRPVIDKYYEDALYVPPMPWWNETEAKWDGDIDNAATIYAQMLKPEIPTGTGLWLWPVATGASGAIILGRIGHGTYLRPGDKTHGPLWRQDNPALLKHYVALLDDCIFTGKTMRYAHEQCTLAGLEVIREVVMLGDYPPKQVDTNAIPFLLGGALDDGCPCACHNGAKGIRHIVACHIPMLQPGDPSLPVE